LQFPFVREGFILAFRRYSQNAATIVSHLKISESNNRLVVENSGTSETWFINVLRHVLRRPVTQTCRNISTNALFKLYGSSREDNTYLSRVKSDITNTLQQFGIWECDEVCINKFTVVIVPNERDLVKVANIQHYLTYVFVNERYTNGPVPGVIMNSSRIYFKQTYLKGLVDILTNLGSCDVVI